MNINYFIIFNVLTCEIARMVPISRFLKDQRRLIIYPALASHSDCS